jgi:hypothetical protein
MYCLNQSLIMTIVLNQRSLYVNTSTGIGMVTFPVNYNPMHQEASYTPSAGEEQLVTAQSQCSAGSYGLQADTFCTQCPVGTYSLAGASACSNCSAFSTTLSAGASVCIPLPGYYDMTKTGFLHRRFTYDSFNPTLKRWHDVSPNKIHATASHTSIGTYSIAPVCESGDGAAAKVCFWKGNAVSQAPDADTVEFQGSSVTGPIIPYVNFAWTLCIVEKYATQNVNFQKRILDTGSGLSMDTIIGLSETSTAGVMLSSSWKAVTVQPGFNATDWLIACTKTGAPDKTYFNGYDVSNPGVTKATGKSVEIFHLL